MGLFKIIMLLVFAYLIYSIVRFALALGKGLRETRKKQQKEFDDLRKKYEKRDSNVIELDKDQYTIE